MMTNLNAHINDINRMQYKACNDNKDDLPLEDCIKHVNQFASDLRESLTSRMSKVCPFQKTLLCVDLDSLIAKLIGTKNNNGMKN